ncbi:MULTISPECIES: histidine phosphatase family protein [unclassified Streptomyces]|uniref:SixA phosphatase family protein n=1 Tax=unclassified Streptomyces TaxID=2593676 RepID=UPI000CD554EC|nr:MULTISPECIES: histidine phosphatase family protein [unclassified Streptomyces]
MSTDNPRRIVLLRHAKADWPEVPDHDRPLAERGRRDAPAAGRRLTDEGIRPDLTLCSTAARTRETWKLLAPELPHRPPTRYEDRVYEASPGELIALINEVEDEARQLLLIGHNPGVHGLADVLTGAGDPEATTALARSGFPTAALAVLTVDGDWGSVEPGSATLTAFWTPGG